MLQHIRTFLHAFRTLRNIQGRLIIARSVAHDDLKEGLLARRFYAVAQHFNDIRLEFLIDNKAMGSRLRQPEGTELPLRVSVSKAGAPYVADIEIVTTSNTIALENTGNTLQGSVTVGPNEQYFFVRAKDPETDSPIAFSSPIWLMPGTEPLPYCAAP